MSGINVIILCFCCFIVGFGIATIINVVQNRVSSNGILVVVQETEHADPSLLLDISREEIDRITTLDTVQFRVKHSLKNPRVKHKDYYEDVY